MHDPVEIRRRIDRLLACLSRRDDYGELLANGYVARQVEEADAWRAAIRAQARADRIEARTGADGCAVYALLVGRPDDDTGDGEYMAALKDMAARAAALRHEPALVARHRSEMLMGCDRCPALGFADAEAAASSIPAAPTRRNRRRRRSASCRHARRDCLALAPNRLGDTRPDHGHDPLHDRLQLRAASRGKSRASPRTISRVGVV